MIYIEKSVQKKYVQGKCGHKKINQRNNVCVKNVCIK